MNEEIMDKILEKCKDDAQYAEAFDHLLKVCQAAAKAGFTNDELANTCLLGWMIGMDPSLGSMIQAMSKISKMGLDIVEK
tara:strand:- start:67 stop:306 length:240 start_codon:yes stop_codon:yes gene_type:complete